ncbi:MAG: TrkA family potassium uptake protein [Thermodesulfobacteria bacterium]|nr:TrkA family potassium uptake protein [Thermodesulfobacteriota bacterium]
MAKYVVIGLGKFGFYLAKKLAEEKQDVLCMDKEESLVEEISKYVSEAVVGDATKKEVLKGLGVKDAAGVIVAIGDLASSILITLYLRELGCKFILAKANDEDHARILSLIGADRVVIPEKDSAIKEAQALVTPNIVDFLPLLPDFSVAKMDPPPEFVGKSFKELGLRSRYHVYVIAIRNKHTGRLILLPSADHVIDKDEELYLLGRKEDLQALSRKET